jgi:hypothetical protein
MSEEHAPLLPLAFCGYLLGASLNMAVESAIAGSKVSAEIGGEMFSFLNEGSSLSSDMVRDLAEGAKGELIHGVKEGGKLFSVMIEKTEITFERCGSAIIGRLQDDDQGVLSKEIGEKISSAYQNLLSQIESISVSSDPIMIAHNQAMEETYQSIAKLDAESKLIQLHIEALEKQRDEIREQQKAHEQIQQNELQQNITEAQNLLAESLLEIENTIDMSEHKSLALQSERKQQDAIQAEQKEKLKTLRLRKAQSKEFLQVHNLRTKEHITNEVQRILTEHGMDNPDIEISEDNDNQIRIRIEE